MTDGRETLQRELEKAAFALMKQRDCKAAIEADPRKDGGE